MRFIEVKCPQCGANIEIEDKKETGKCKYCGSSFLMEKNEKNTPIKNERPSDKKENYLQLARRAREIIDLDNAIKYYSLYLENNPNDWESFFYITYCRFEQSTIETVPTSAIKFNNTLDSIFKILITDITVKDVLYNYIIKIQQDIFDLSTKLFSQFKNFFSQNKFEIKKCSTYNFAISSITNVLYTFGDLVERYFLTDKEYQLIAVDSWKKAIEIRKSFFSNNPIYGYTGVGDTEESIKNEIFSYSQKIKKIEKSYVSFIEKGCYIATCIYGSYDCPQVWTLRRFRDDKLDTKWYGRAFIKIYYAISPTLVKWFGKKMWFNKMGKKKLDRMVNKLLSQGMEDTPYHDKEWK